MANCNALFLLLTAVFGCVGCKGTFEMSQAARIPTRSSLSSANIEHVLETNSATKSINYSCTYKSDSLRVEINKSLTTQSRAKGVAGVITGLGTTVGGSGFVLATRDNKEDYALAIGISTIVLGVAGTLVTVLWEPSSEDIKAKQEKLMGITQNLDEYNKNCLNEESNECLMLLGNLEALCK